MFVNSQISGINTQRTGTRLRAFAVSFVAIVLLSVGVCTAAQSEAPQIESWTTKNGVKVLFVSDHQLPMVDLRIAFDAGGARDGALPGLALLTNGMLTEGTGDLNANDIAKHFEGLGARLGNSSHRDMAIISLRSLSDEKLLTPAIDMLTKIVTAPSFPKDSFERETKRALISIQASKQSIDDVAEKAFYKNLYGEHSYAIPTEGTEESIGKITLQDLRTFYQRYYVGNNALLAIMGDLTRKQAEALADHLVGKLPSGEAAPRPADVAPLKDANVVRINHPSQQTHVLIGQPAITRTDPDFFALYLGNHILGGSGLVSRLSEEIRENRGLSYSVHSGFTPMRLNGPYSLELQTRNDQAEEALKIMRETLEKFIAEGPTDEEIRSAKQNITGSFPLRIASNSSIVEYLAMIGFYGLPLDYLDTFNSKIDAVAKKDIVDAFQRRIHPDKMVTIVIGGTQ